MLSGSSYPIRLTRMLYDQTGSGKSNITASRTRSTFISACRDRSIVSTVIFMFLGFSYSMGMMKLLDDLNGSHKFKMASFKMYISISKLVDKITSKFQR